MVQLNDGGDMSESDTRQYKNMLEALASYKNNKMDLSNLISTLEFLLGALNECTETFRGEFLKDWGVLEDGYSMFVASGQKQLSSEAKKDIDTVIDALSIIITDKAIES